MNINDVIVLVVAVFVIVGAIDRALGNRFGLGEQFEKGMMTYGPLALSMVGMVCVAPVLAKVLSPIIVPVYAFLGADPAIFAGTLLAIDMGGYPLAMELAQTSEAGLLGGIILAVVLGPTVVFTIPVGLGIVPKENRPEFANGVLVGVLTSPIGVLTGGLMAGLDLSTILSNLVPIVIAVVLIALGLRRFPDAMTHGFLAFGRFLIAIITIALGIATFEFLTGMAIMPPGWEMTPVMDGMTTVAKICLFLTGAFTLINLIVRVARKPLAGFGRLMGINEIASGGLLMTLATVIPVYQMMREMDERGVFIVTTWSVAAQSVLGGHLGFIAGVEPRMITPMIVGKLTAALTAVVLAYLIALKRYPACDVAVPKTRNTATG